MGQFTNILIKNVGYIQASRKIPFLILILDYETRMRISFPFNGLANTMLSISQYLPEFGLRKILAQPVPQLQQLFRHGAWQVLFHPY